MVGFCVGCMMGHGICLGIWLEWRGGRYNALVNEILDGMAETETPIRAVTSIPMKITILIRTVAIWQRVPWRDRVRISELACFE